MNNSRFGNRSGGGRDSFRGGFGGRGSDRPHEMYDAVCSECGKDCKVPFRPSGDRPIFCSDCFEKQNGGSDRSERRPSFERSDRPRFNDRGGDRGPAKSFGGAEFSMLNKNIEILNGKLDKLIAALGANPALVKAVESAGVVRTSGEFKSKKIEGLAGMVASFKTNDKPSETKKKKRTLKSVVESKEE